MIHKPAFLWLLSIMCLGCHYGSEQPKQQLVEPNRVDTSVITATDFLEKLHFLSNLIKKPKPNNFACKVLKDKDSTFSLHTKFTIAGCQLEYTIKSKDNFDEPYLYLFDQKNYIGSTLRVNNTLFDLDSLSIEPLEMGKGKINTAFSIMSMGIHAHFSFNGKQYVVIEALPPCNGSYCIEHYLLLIENDPVKPKIIPIVFNAYHPLTEAFVGDYNKDGLLDFYCIYPPTEQTYAIKIYTLNSSNHLESITDIDGKDTFVYYSCERCSGETSDTLIILKQNIW